MQANATSPGGIDLQTLNNVDLMVLTTDAQVEMGRRNILTDTPGQIGDLAKSYARAQNEGGVPVDLSTLHAAVDTAASSS